MERVLVVRCPDLESDDEGGHALRAFARVVAAVGAYCPWTTTVRPGVCSLPARGPARYFGGEAALVDLVATAATAAAPALPTPQVGIADGLFAALAAARAGLVVPPGETASFLSPLPVGELVDPALAGLLARLGIRTVGAFAALPPGHVAGRFGTAGTAAHRVARGESGSTGPPGPPGRPVAGGPAGRGAPSVPGGGTTGTSRQPGFWGGVRDADLRASRCLAGIQRLLGPDGVGTVRTQGGRGPGQQTRFVTWNGRGAPDGGPDDTGSSADPRGPWPGRIPPPAPMLVHLAPRPAELAAATGAPISVSGRGLLSDGPRRLSIDGGRWMAVDAWAGPWPCDERWWSRSRRRSARLQVVTGGECRLLAAERGRWWVEATYG